MSVNIYFSGTVKHDESFKCEERDNRAGSKYQHIEWAGVRLSHIDNDGRPVFIMSSIDDQPPLALQDKIINKVTVKETFTGQFRRRIGVYVPRREWILPGMPGLCRAVLDLHPTTRNYELTIEAPTLTMARQFYHGIRNNELVPFEPWDLERDSTYPSPESKFD